MDLPEYRAAAQRLEAVRDQVAAAQQHIVAPVSNTHLDGVSPVMDFLDRHLPEKFRPLVERARELLPVLEDVYKRQGREMGLR